jgi:ubiquinone/menaquinone biosynthesis C-methylase UbiE
MEKLKSYLKNYPDAKILDMGSGRGNFISLIDDLYQDYREIVGIDIVDYLLEMNAKAFGDNPNIHIFDEDILNTNLGKDSFDIVCLSNTLHHLDDIAATFCEMKKLVKPDGIIIINEMISDHLNNKQISHKLLHHFAAKIDTKLGRIHQQTFTEQRIIDVIEAKSDLKIVDHWRLQLETEPKVEENIEEFVNTIDKLLLQVKNCEEFPRFEEEAKELKNYLKENGFAMATQVVLVLEK